MLLSNVTVELTTTLTAIGGIGVVIALITSAVAFYRTKLSKDTIEVLKENNSALVARVDLLTKDVETLRHVNETLAGENETLRSIASADRAIKEMNRTLAEGQAVILAAIQDALG